MSYAGVQMFRERLNQLINSNDIPFFKNQEIIDARPQFQFLYQELESMIQILFLNEHQDLHDLEIVKDLKKRFTDAAEEAQYIVDLFLSGVHIRSNGHSPTSDDFTQPLNLDDVNRSFNSIKVELNQSAAAQRTLNQSAHILISRDSLESSKLMDETVVGLDRDLERIRDKLTADEKKVDVVSVVGMGGIGKTTLATKVFNDPFVKSRFHVRVWVTVSQTYDKRSVLTHMLASMGVNLDLEKASDSSLCHLVYKHLFHRKYLIVLDDVWHKETWDNLKLFFPNHNNGSRILLTSRHSEVAKHANPDGLIHQLGYLSTRRSWELLCRKVFQGTDSPNWSFKPGMQIVENCHGLPLAVVVIARVLAKDAWSEKFWAEIAYRTASYIVDNKNGCLETLALSYNHLPLHLKECLLYLGGFPEDYTFQVQRLIWLWVAEGFIQQTGNRNLEDVADSYLMDLIDRNLVIVADRGNSDGGIKACKVHDLIRELCLQKAEEEQFIIQLERPLSNQFSIVPTPSKPVRMFTHKDLDILNFAQMPTQNLRSMFWFSNFTSLGDDFARFFRSFVLLRVLDLLDCRLHDFPNSMKLLVHLRYLAIWNASTGFPDSICNLWSLQTIVCISYDRMVLPSNISDLVNLRHLWSYLPFTNKAMGIRSFETPFFLTSIGKPMKLQTISNVELGDGVDNFQKCFPYIKELTCTTYLDEQNDFQSLTCLEKLKLTCLSRMIRSTAHDSPKGEPSYGKNHITFPATLKTLTLVLCRLPWGDMSILQSLPNLQVLKLRHKAFEGSCWNTEGQEFRQLKFLRLERLNIKLWEASSQSFPCLRQLKIFNCLNLENIPIDIGNMPMLELIKIKDCRDSVGESVKRIEEEQQYYSGHCQFKIDISMESQISF